MVKQIKTGVKSDWRSRMNMSFKRPVRKIIKKINPKSKTRKSKTKSGRVIKKRRYFKPGVRGPRAQPDYWQTKNDTTGENTKKANQLEQEEYDMVMSMRAEAKSYCKQGYAITSFVTDKVDKSKHESEDEESADDWSSSDEDEEEIDYGSDDEDFC